METIIALAAALIGAAIATAVTVIVQRSAARSRAKLIIEDAQREAEDLKKSKLLEGREEALTITRDAEKQANQRMAKIQSTEAKQKQRELQLNQQQSENQRTRNELEAARTKIEEQHAANEARRDELERIADRFRSGGITVQVS